MAAKRAPETTSPEPSRTKRSPRGDVGDLLDQLYRVARCLTPDRLSAERLVHRTVVAAADRDSVFRASRRALLVATMYDQLCSNIGADQPSDSDVVCPGNGTRRRQYVTPSTGPDDDRAHMRQALSQLPLPCRIAVVLRDVAGFTHQEMARILGTSRREVRVLISHARQQLSARLCRSQDGDSPPVRPSMGRLVNEMPREATGAQSWSRSGKSTYELRPRQGLSQFRRRFG